MIWSDDKVQQIRDRRVQGHSASAIAADLGVTRSAVLGVCRRKKITGGHLRTPLPPAAARRATPKKAQPSPSADEAPAAPELPAAAAALGRVALLDLRFDSCRWPLGSPGDADFGFCGAQRANDGVAYCPEHCRIAFTKRTG